MNAPRTQYLVFTGLDETLFRPDSTSIKEIRPALKLIHSQNIPLILTSDKTTAQILPYLEILGGDCLFIVESGAALFIPQGKLEIGYHYQRTTGNFHVIEFGIPRERIHRQVADISKNLALDTIFISDLTHRDSKQYGLKLSKEALENFKERHYSEAIIFKTGSADRQRFDKALEQHHLRIKEHDDYLIITGDHDEGTAVRFLVQLYREEFPDARIVTIGLGARWMDAPALYAVDKPVLLRKPDGRFDERVGRRGMRFTRYPGSIGWNQAVVALLTGRED